MSQNIIKNNLIIVSTGKGGYKLNIKERICQVPIPDRVSHVILMLAISPPRAAVSVGPPHCNRVHQANHCGQAAIEHYQYHRWQEISNSLSKGLNLQTLDAFLSQIYSVEFNKRIFLECWSFPLYQSLGGLLYDPLCIIERGNEESCSST